MTGDGGPEAAPAIDDYALIGDANGAALVSRAGSIDWACLPRFDSPATFARILDHHAGHWLLAPRDGTTETRRYLDGTMVLETRFQTATGSAVATDALVLGEDEQGHELGSSAPHLLARRIACRSGSVEVQVELALRPEYGLAVPVLGLVDGGARGRGGSIDYAISAPVPLRVSDGVLTASVTLAAGASVAFGLQMCAPGGDPPLRSSAELEAALDGTVRTWRSWTAQHATYDGPYAAEVAHSSRVLQTLTYAPTGAIVAAATSSLPEIVGGVRNWDYRFCWARDASATLQALSIGACRDEATRFLQFLATAGIANGCDTPTPVMYGVCGERFVPEVELQHLRGYRGSRPVRMGNAAWSQRQNDIYGAIIDAAHQLIVGAPDGDDLLTGPVRDLLVRLADAAAEHWQEPDHGIWEQRDVRRHYLYSKLMCWVALDRAIDLAPRLDAVGRVAAWGHERQRVRDAILDQGWNDEVGAYTQAFGSSMLDASALKLGLVGFLPWADGRLRATVDAILECLTDRDGLVYRSRRHGGGRPPEGTFTLCSFWLAEALAQLGQRDRAAALFDRIVARANDVGLFSEQLGADGGGMLGNVPQTYSHVGLIVAAAAFGHTATAGPGDADGRRGASWPEAPVTSSG